MYGGDDGARTRDLGRDSTEAGSNLLKLSATDGFFWRSEVTPGNRYWTLIGPSAAALLTSARTTALDCYVSGKMPNEAERRC
jgi:hypothetical protein